PRSTQVGRGELGREGVQVRLVAGRDLQDGGLGLDEVLRREPGPNRRRDARARQQAPPPVRVNMRRPPWLRGHNALPRQPKSDARKSWQMGAISVCCAPTSRPAAADPLKTTEEFT